MRIVALSISTSKKAGEIIRNVMSSNQLNIVEKVSNCVHLISYQSPNYPLPLQSHRDYQTEADRSSQKCIIASLAKQFPGICIVGEEGESDLNVPTDWLVTEPDLDFLSAHTCPDYLQDVEDKNVIVWWVRRGEERVENN